MTAPITAAVIASWSPERRRRFYTGLTTADALKLQYEWEFWAREKQLPPPGDWRTWLVMAGRGFGKTRCGAEWVRDKIESGKYGRLALVARTASDVRDVVVEGESGLLRICPAWNYPLYNPSKRRLTWPNGAVASLYSADEPDVLRGPQHDGAWADEVGAWRYAETWDQLMFGLRLGNDPRCVVTTTPRPTQLLREIMAQPSTVITRGTTYENRGHLAPAFFEQIVKKYEGTRLGRQELMAEFLEDNPHALWKREWIEESRIMEADLPPNLQRIVVGVDPAVTSSETSNQTGIVVCAKDRKGHGYVLGDYTLRGTPDEWGAAAVRAYLKHDADRIVAETNQGGQMVEHVIRTVAKTLGRNVAYKGVKASRGKITRAEPISALYEQRLIHHIGDLGALEDEQCEWSPDQESPDRMDALVWALHDLFIEGKDGTLRGAF